ncbi:MAG: amidinotransferase [Bacteroidia bacterium]|nr:amidinotransferase [Bacteroidia bacterium]
MLVHHHIAHSVLMVRPAKFSFNPETSSSNSFQNKLEVEKVSDIALEEFDGVVDQLRNEGIEVFVSQSDDLLAPDCIFPNNCFSTHEKNKLFIYPMMAANRQRERNGNMLVDLKNNFEVDEIHDLSKYEKQFLFLEGTGSIVFDHLQKIAYAIRSPRTNEVVLQEVCFALNYTPFLFTCIDAHQKPIYHTNVIMNMGLGYVMYYEDGIIDPIEKDKLLHSFKNGNLEAISITWNQVLHFCGNMLQLQNKEGKLFTVCSSSAYQNLTLEQKGLISKRSNFLVVDIRMIEKIGGGGIRCMLAEVFLKPRRVKHVDGFPERT